MGRIRSFTVFALLAVLVSGCRHNSALTRDQAASILRTSLFATAQARETAMYVSGDRKTRPLALDEFLYAKHWTGCEAGETGPFAASTRCRLNDEGRTYGAANGWSPVSVERGGCARCEVWHIPLAHAALRAVGAVELADADRATASYTYLVTPNEFGAQLAAWMADHPIAWCGPNPAAIGVWNRPRTAQASFERVKGHWVLANPASPTFDATFADPSAKDQPCASL